MFPHAILHEASITFLGFGLSSEQPAIGIILSESMRYLITGKWWLAMLPGLMLVLTVVLFDVAGNSCAGFSILPAHRNKGSSFITVQRAGACTVRNAGK